MCGCGCGLCERVGSVCGECAYIHLCICSIFIFIYYFYVHAYTYIYLYVYTCHVYKYTYEHGYILTHTHACTHVILVCVGKLLQRRVHVCADISVCICACMYAYSCIFIWYIIHTHLNVILVGLQGKPLQGRERMYTYIHAA